MNVNNVRKIAEKWAVKSWLSKCSFASLKFSLLDETRTGQKSATNERYTIFLLESSLKDPARCPVRALFDLNGCYFFLMYQMTIFEVIFHPPVCEYRSS